MEICEIFQVFLFLPVMGYNVQLFTRYLTVDVVRNSASSVPQQ